MTRRRSIGIVLAGLLAGCNDAPADISEQTVVDRLPGTWLREFEEKGVRVRRILVLESDGRFREMVRITDASGTVIGHIHSGSWFYDGTNLKRKYSSFDGKPTAAPTVPFAAFELKFPSRNEFIGIDNVHRREVRYQRVQPETLP